MKLWTMLICSTRKSVSGQIEKLDAQIYRLALKPYLPADKQSERIVQKMNDKNMLLNFVFLYDRLKSELGAQSVDMMTCYAQGGNMRASKLEYGLEGNVTERRALAEAARGAAILRSLGFTKEKFERDYARIDWIAREYERLSSRLLQPSFRPKPAVSVKVKPSAFSCRS